MRRAIEAMLVPAGQQTSSSALFFFLRIINGPSVLHQAKCLGSMYASRT
jgi:hypothetical protein